MLTAILVALCLPYRKAHTITPQSNEYPADTTETQRERGRAVFCHWQSERQDFGHLHEEGGGRWFQSERH